jgi:hypothetical protein
MGLGLGGMPIQNFSQSGRKFNVAIFTCIGGDIV